MRETLRLLSEHLSAEQLQPYVELLERGTSQTGRLDQFVAEQPVGWQRAMADLGLSAAPQPQEFAAAIQSRVMALNQALQTELGLRDVGSADAWQRLIAHLRSQLPEDVLAGYFVKREVVANQLRVHPPRATLRYLGYADIETALAGESLFELMAAVRFSESEDWMESFLGTYARLQPGDFENRPVEFIVLDPRKWWKLAEPFARKKKHHFSHLKELGVVFSYPEPNQASLAKSRQASDSAALHISLAMILHYIFEVRFYSDFFKANVGQLEHFGAAFIEILKGDTNICAISQYQLPIIQQYHLKKARPNPCVFRPHVMPEVLHWHKARQALLNVVAHHPDYALFQFWNTCYTVGSVQQGTLLTLNFADNILTNQEILNYHYKEDLWNRLFTLYFSEAKLEQVIIKNFAAKAIDLRQLFSANISSQRKTLTNRS